MTQTITVDGRDVRFERAEPAEGVHDDGPSILLIHGINRSLDDWHDAQALLARNHRVYSLDLPGFGLSDPLVGRVRLDLLAKACHDFLDTVGETRPVVVVGNSLGGAVALQLAVSAPKRVAALVLIDPAGFGREVTVVLRALAIPVLGKRLLKGDRETLRRTERAIYFSGDHVTDERLDRAALYGARPHNGRVLLETARALGTVRGVRRRWRERLLASAAGLAIPIFVMWGRDDRILPATHLDNARRALPNARFHLWDDTGHMAQVEHPGEFVDRVETFLTESFPTGQHVTEDAR